MNIFIWSVIIILFITSFIGLFIPFFPAILFIWIGFFLYEFIINGPPLSIMFWVSMAILTMFIFVSDFLTNKYFVGKFGGSKQSEWGAIIAFIVGLFVYPPIGIIVLPFVTVFIIEYFQANSTKHAFRSAMGTIIAFFSSIFVKGFVQLIMIIWFLIVVLI